jgi:hypothetical protein
MMGRRVDMVVVLESGKGTGGNHFYDKNQAIACSTSCIMPSGLMRYCLLITFSEFFIYHFPLDISLRFSYQFLR